MNCYPPPKHDKIIEPFAGSAKYALKYFDREVLLVDKYSGVVEIWDYLKQASRKDILGLPILKTGETLKSFSLSGGELMLLRYNVSIGACWPVWKCSSMCTEEWQLRNLKRIAKDLFKIKHWKVKQGSFEQIKNEKATWFIDPPYQFGGDKYKESNKNIDFNQLSNWCKSRQGQTIVCENTKADWMAFKPMKKLVGTLNTTVEAIWSNLETAYDNEQLKLF